MKPVKPASNILRLELPLGLDVERRAARADLSVRGSLRSMRVRASGTAPRPRRCACVTPFPSRAARTVVPRGAPGAPYSARFTAARRSYRCRSCSHVIPMPPWSCTHSLEDLDRHPADVGLRDADVSRRVRARGAHRDRGCLRTTLRRLQHQQHVGEPVLQRLIRGERSSERPSVLEVLERSRRTSGRCAPTVSATCNASASWHWCSMSFAAPPTSPTTELRGTRTDSNRRSANRRTRSTLRPGTTVSPGASAATSTCVGPAGARALTSTTSAPVPASTNRLRPDNRRSAPSSTSTVVDEPSTPHTSAIFGQRPGGGRRARHQPRHHRFDQRGRAGTCRARRPRRSPAPTVPARPSVPSLRRRSRGRPPDCPRGSHHRATPARAATSIRARRRASR